MVVVLLVAVVVVVLVLVLVVLVVHGQAIVGSHFTHRYPGITSSPGASTYISPTKSAASVKSRAIRMEPT